nr:oleate hydratase [Bradyrhizobium sp. CIR3A]
MDGSWCPERGFVIRGGREMEEHSECLWNLFRSILSLRTRRRQRPRRILLAEQR